MSSEEIISRIRTSGLRNGHRSVEPPVLNGMLSGIAHRFSLVLSMEGRFCAFDIYSGVGVTEVLRTRVKILDTRASGYIVSSSSTVAPEVRELSREYGVSLVTADEIKASEKPKNEGDEIVERTLEQLGCGVAVVVAKKQQGYSN